MMEVKKEQGFSGNAVSQGMAYYLQGISNHPKPLGLGLRPALLITVGINRTYVGKFAPLFHVVG